MGALIATSGADAAVLTQPDSIDWLLNIRGADVPHNPLPLSFAILEADVASRRSGLRATGTGTDCIAIASPLGKMPDAYAGKHTRVGHLVGASVLDAVSRAASAWKRERA